MCKLWVTIKVQGHTSDVSQCTGHTEGHQYKAAHYKYHKLFQCMLQNSGIVYLSSYVCPALLNFLKRILKPAYLDRHLAILPTSDVSFLIFYGTVVVMLSVILLYCIEIYVHDNVPSVLLFTGRLMRHVSGAKSIFYLM